MFLRLKKIRYVLIFFISLTNNPICAEEQKSENLTFVCYNIRQDTDSDKGPKDWTSRKAVVSDYLLKKNASIIGPKKLDTIN